MGYQDFWLYSVLLTEGVLDARVQVSRDVKGMPRILHGVLCLDVPSSRLLDGKFSLFNLLLQFCVLFTSVYVDVIDTWVGHLGLIHRDTI